MKTLEKTIMKTLGSMLLILFVCSSCQEGKRNLEINRKKLDKIKFDSFLVFGGNSPIADSLYYPTQLALDTILQSEPLRNEAYRQKYYYYIQKKNHLKEARFCLEHISPIRCFGMKAPYTKQVYIAIINYKLAQKAHDKQNEKKYYCEIFTPVAYYSLKHPSEIEPYFDFFFFKAIINGYDNVIEELTLLLTTYHKQNKQFKLALDYLKWMPGNARELLIIE